VKDGETIVIGGLLQKNETTVKRKIPLLGDIPILGLLFSRTDKRVDEIETVIFITPHILAEGAISERKE
jgi:type II secretory pathway component GspD/PulD (secretin)